MTQSNSDASTRKHNAENVVENNSSESLESTDVAEEIIDAMIDPDVQLHQEMGIQGTVGKVLADLTGGLLEPRTMSSGDSTTSGVQEATESSLVEESEDPATEDATSKNKEQEKKKLEGKGGELEVEELASQAQTDLSTDLGAESKREEGNLEQVELGAESKREEGNLEQVELDAESKGRVGVQEPQWIVQFAALPEMEHQDVVEQLQAGNVVKGYSIPFLNLKELNLEHPVLFEDCYLTGMAARGTTFQQGLCLRNCWVEERFVVGDTQKANPVIPSSIQGHVRLEGCRFDGRFSIIQTEITGDFRSVGCLFAQPLSLDRCHILGQVSLSNGKIFAFSLFRAVISKHLFVSKVTMKGTRKSPSLSLKRARLAGGVELRECTLEGNVDLSRIHVGESVRRALRMERCTLKRIFLNQAVFCGEVQIQDTTFLGFLSAEPLRSEHGHLIGRPATFEGDTTFGGCDFKGKCNFQSARFLEKVNFSHCLFHKGASFNQATFSKDASFWESESSASLHFRKAVFEGTANFGHTVLADRTSFNEASFAGEATFYDSEFKGDVFFSGAHFAGNLKLGRLRCKGGLILQNIDVEGQVNLLQSVIDDRLILSESRLGSLHAPGVQVGTWASLAEATVREDVILSGCKVGNKVEPTDDIQQYTPGSFYLDSAVFQGCLKMSNMFVLGNLSLENVNVHQEVELMGGRVDADLILSKGYFRDIVRCERSAVAGGLVAQLTRFRDEVSWNHITCKRVSLNASSFDQGFTMRGATIQDVLTLNNVDVDGKADLSKCSFQRFFFDHLLVDYLMIEREQLGDHLSSETIGNYAQAKNEYGILRQAFLVRNRYQDMDWAYYRFCQSSRKEKKKSFTTGLEWLLFDLGFGYGTKPMNIAGVALSIVLLFATLFSYVPQGITNSAKQALSHIGALDSIHLSVLTFASMEYSSELPHAGHWLTYFFAIEGLLGIFLITLFVATISRKIIRT